MSEPTTRAPKRIVVIFASQDRGAYQALIKQLSNLKRQQLIETWSEEELRSGQLIEPQLSDNLREADIILILISPDYVASDEKYEQLLSAIALHERKGTHLVPILVRPTEQKNAPYAQFQMLPRDQTAVSDAKGRAEDRVWHTIATALRHLIEEGALPPPVGPGAPSRLQRLSARVRVGLAVFCCAALGIGIYAASTFLRSRKPPAAIAGGWHSTVGASISAGPRQVIIHIDLSFRSLEFNVADYLQVFRALQVEGADPEQPVEVRLVAGASESWFGSAHADVLIPLPGPSSPGRLKLSIKGLGPLRHEVDLSTLYFSLAEPPQALPGCAFPLGSSAAGPRWHASTSVRLDDPLWLAFSEARLLLAADPDKQEFLVEGLLTNRGGADVALGEVTLLALSDPGDRCADSDPPNPLQHLFIDWQRLITNGAERGGDVARTQLGTTSLRVPGTLRLAGCGHYEHEFSASIPLSLSVPARSVRRFTLSIKELPSGLRQRTGKRFLLPESLRDWQRITLRFPRSAIAVYPAERVVTRLAPRGR